MWWLSFVHGGVVIMDVEATTAVRQAEVTAQRVMLDRTQERFGIWPERLAADTGYGSAENLAWLVHERGIEPHIPVFEKSDRSDGSFARSDFTYDHKRDRYICPGGGRIGTVYGTNTYTDDSSADPTLSMLQPVQGLDVVAAQEGYTDVALGRNDQLTAELHQHGQDVALLQDRLVKQQSQQKALISTAEAPGRPNTW